MQKKLYKNYISSLKGFACFFVMLGHYIGLVKYSSDLSGNFAFFNFMKEIHLDFLLNESFWLQLFFVVSGYLLAQSSINSIRKFAVKSSMRFLRLGIPILLANCIIIFLYYIVGFKNSETNTLFANDWFQNAYPTELNFILLLKSPIDTLLLSKCYFNSTYWVLRDMFLASIAVYGYAYIKSKIKKDIIGYFAYLIILFIGLLLSNVIFVCLIGLGLYIFENIIHKYLNQTVSVCILLGSFILNIFFEQRFIIVLFFSCLILLSPKIKYINSFLELKFFDYIGKISFGIYVFHWPVICSIGSYVILGLSDRIGLVMSIFVAVIISVVVSVGLAVLFNKTAENWCSKIINVIQSKVM